jgi:hypothetical protein
MTKYNYMMSNGEWVVVVRRHGGEWMKISSHPNKVEAMREAFELNSKHNDQSREVLQ